MMLIHMMASFLALSLSLLIFASPTGLPLRSTEDTILPGYATGIAQWKGVVNGVEYHLNGTLQQILPQLEILDPELAHSVESDTILGQDTRENELLDARNIAGLLCCPVAGQNFQWAVPGDIQRSINALVGRGYIGAPGRTCVRVLCSGTGAIFLCNDNPGLEFIYAYDVQTHAQAIMNRCNLDHWAVCGQQFDTDSWNIIVQGGQRCE